MDHSTIGQVIVGAAVGLAIGIAILLLFGLILQWLWNTTLPDVLGAKSVTLMQAIKVMFISSLLFGGHRVVAPGDDYVDAPDSAVQPANAD